MPRARLFTIRGSFLLGALASLGSFVIVGQGRARAAVVDEVRPIAPADPIPADIGLSDVTLPGGLRAALAAIKDYNPPDRSQFLIELIRRVHNLASGPAGSHDATLVALLAHLDAAAAAPTTTADTLPLPLAPSIWIASVFGGRSSATTLASDILRSRNASLFYAGLLSVDAETRAFLAAQPALVTELSSRLAPGFVIASPGLRVAGSRVVPPGGERAAAAWEALVGRRLADPAEFVRALLVQNERHTAWYFGSLGQLTPAQLERVLDLDAPETQRTASMRRLHDVFVRVASDWRLDGRTFWRPAVDPALLASWLPAGADGRPVLPATRGFWQAVFADSLLAPARREGREPPVDFAWLSEQVFDGSTGDHRRRLQQVLFAARLPTPSTPQQLAETADAVRAAGRYPALVGVLERVHVDDAALFARAARHAAEISSIDAGPRAARALTQFQGLLTVIARAASRGSIEPTAAQDLVRSFLAIDRSQRGDYDGRLVEWLDAQLQARHASTAAPSIEQQLLQLVAGPPPDVRRTIEWEGSRYRVDLAAAETTRLERMLGEHARPWFSSAHALVSLAAALNDPARVGAARARAADTLSGVARASGWMDAVPDPRQADAIARFKTLADVLARKPRGAATDVESAERAASALRGLADDVFARGLLELTYAIALGQSDRAWITADEASAGHDFGLSVAAARQADAAWRRPVAGADQRREWRASGSLLGLDVSLSELSLMRLSTRPPPRRPTINEEDRRAIVETVVLVEPAAITDAGRDRLVAAIARGRARVAAATTPAALVALASEIHLSTSRQTLLAWTAARDPARVAASLSPIELLWLGAPSGNGASPSNDAALHAWGITAEPTLACLCLRLPVQQPWEVLAGRWGTGLFATAFPDLSLRLAELLAGLQMPSELLAPVLPAAALDLANTAAVRGQDDRRSFVEFVQALTPAHVEQYLALLTTGGPLVPVDGIEDVTATRPGAPR